MTEYTWIDGIRYEITYSETVETVNEKGVWFRYTAARIERSSNDGDMKSVKEISGVLHSA